MYTKVSGPCDVDSTVAILLIVNDSTMLEYIRNKTAAPYFSNLVWFIGSNVIELDECIRCQAE